MKMNTGVLAVGMALVVGAAGGFVLSGLIGIAGYLFAGRAVGIRYLPLILPIVGAGVALLVMQNERMRKSGKE